MKIGDLVTFAPHEWGTPLEDRPLGIVVQVGVIHPGDWDTGLQMVTARFFDTDVPYSSKAKDFEVVSENW